MCPVFNITFHKRHKLNRKFRFKSAAILAMMATHIQCCPHLNKDAIVNKLHALLRVIMFSETAVGFCCLLYIHNNLLTISKKQNKQKMASCFLNYSESCDSPEYPLFFHFLCSFIAECSYRCSVVAKIETNDQFVNVEAWCFSP